MYVQLGLEIILSYRLLAVIAKYNQLIAQAQLWYVYYRQKSSRVCASASRICVFVLNKSRKQAFSHLSYCYGTHQRSGRLFVGLQRLQ